jgi:hypothetical protein
MRRAVSIGLSGDSATPIRAIEVLCEDAEGFLRVVFVHLRSLTAKSRNDLARVLGRTNVDHLLIPTSDFDTLEFVLLDKRRRESRGPVEVQRIQVVPLSLAVARKAIGIFDGPIIAWPDTAKHPRFCMLPPGAVIGNTAFCVSAEFSWLLPFLNSQIGWQIISCNCQSRDERAGKLRYRLLPQSMDRFPIPRLTASQRDRYHNIATGAIAHSSEVEHDIAELYHALFDE